MLGSCIMLWSRGLYMWIFNRSRGSFCDLGRQGAELFDGIGFASKSKVVYKLMRHTGWLADFWPQSAAQYAMSAYSDVTLTPHGGRWRWILNQLFVSDHKYWENLVADNWLKFSTIYHHVALMWHLNWVRLCGSQVLYFLNFVSTVTCMYAFH